MIATENRNFQWGVEVFATEVEAEARRAVLYEEATKDADNRGREIAAQKRRSISWRVRYHRDYLKKAERDVDYHRRKLSDELSRQRKDIPTTGEG